MTPWLRGHSLDSAYWSGSWRGARSGSSDAEPFESSAKHSTETILRGLSPLKLGHDLIQVAFGRGIRLPVRGGGDEP